MIPLLTREAVRALDAHAVDALGIPGIVLMENAGRGAFDVIRERFGDVLGRVVLVGGPGQNGGDAWVIARHLHNLGHRPKAFLLSARDKLRGDAATSFGALEALGVDAIALEGDDLSALEAALEDASLVVEGLFGTGLDRAIEGRYAQAIEMLREAAAPVVALDLPSGIDADTGGVLGCAVQAALTVTFAAHKRGLHQHPGAKHAGEVHCVSIGVPAPPTAPCGLLEARDVAAWLPSREPDAHKGSAGHVMVIAGGPGRSGAAVLTGLGALRGGAGLVTLYARGQTRDVLDRKVVELMTEPLPEDADAALDAALEAAREKRAAALGPGLGLDAESARLAEQLALRLPLPAVLDADALTALGTDYGALRDAKGPRVLTPHPGEAARLLGRSSAGEVQAERFGAARELAENSGQVTVLKGARSIVADPSGQIAVCPTGTPAMAVAGSGDVLSGVLAALLCTLPPFEAACAGVYLHGLAGELAARADRGLLVRELAAQLPSALSHTRGG